MYKKYANKFYCFSPPVMLFTFALEFLLAIYTLWRYKWTTVTRLVAALLVCLGIFQLAEFMICGGLGLNHVEWAKVGYVSITLLPALGLHLVASISGVKSREVKPLLSLAYGTAAAYVLYFAFAQDSVIGRVCAENYAIFDTHGAGALLYAAYYYGWLLVTVGCAMAWAERNRKARGALRWAAVGYASFIVPTVIVNVADPDTLSGIPSIMCGFAVLLALILVWRVLPLAKVPRRH